MIEVVEGDLLDQPVDAIVNAWNRNLIPWWLLIPQGVSGAIKKRGGVRPFRELGWRPMALGEARITGPGRLPFQAIIHVAGINLLWRASAYSIRESTRNALMVAKERGLHSIAFPIIGAGSGGFDEGKALSLMMEAVGPDPGMRVRLVRFQRSTSRSAPPESGLAALDLRTWRTWEFIGASYGDRPFAIGGVDVFAHRWEPIDSPKAVVSDPLYGQRFEFQVFQVTESGRAIEFAAGEFSNSVWGFYQRRGAENLRQGEVGAASPSADRRN